MDYQKRRDRIRNLYTSGETLEEIAGKLEVTKARIWQIIRSMPDWKALRKEHRSNWKGYRETLRWALCPKCNRGFVRRFLAQKYCSIRCSNRDKPSVHLAKQKRLHHTS